MVQIRHAVVGGGTGFVGTRLCRYLRGKGYAVTIISRMPGPQRITWHDVANNGLPQNTTAVVNLAGQPVLDMTQRWSESFKQNVINSRINTTKNLADAICKAINKPKVFISMSGVGFYEPNTDAEYDENSPGWNSDFLSKLAVKWENAAKLSIDCDCRQVVLRSGVVLGREGGMIKQIYIPFFFGVGGPIGTGDQYLPWIHVNDLVRLIAYAIDEEKVTGVLNAVAPQQITNREFAQAFGNALMRPAFIPVPESILNLILSEERAKIITQGHRVIPKRALELGFQFNYPEIETACKDFTKLIGE